MILCAAALVGLGSSVFHPEASRLARMASGGRYGLAQSVFQVGGNTGQSLGPLLAALVVGTRGQGKIAWFSVLALLAIFILFNAGRWYQSNLFRLKSVSRRPADGVHLSRRTILFSLAILVALIFSKFFYLASISSYYTFYLIDRFHLTIEQAQLLLFLFTFSVAAGTIVGGPVGDRIGRKWVIWVSILGVAPFTLLLPQANLPVTAILSVIIGFILASAFSAILVYAQELMPGKVGMVSGLFFGLAFGMAGIGSAVLGQLIDLTNIRFVFQLCAFLPLLGLLTAFLPDIERKRAG
jgi:MFS transporter, FSR family, fosmidomycin resistance protein